MIFLKMQVPNDESLSEDYEQCQIQWIDLQTKISTISSQLDQIPEKWKQYEAKYVEYKFRNKKSIS